MAREYDTLCGITQEELESYFAEPITELAQEYRQSVLDMMQLLKQRYDGYHFSIRLLDVYNPFSILNVFKKMELQDYWFRSGTPTYLLRLLSHTQEGLDEMTGRYYFRRDFIDYKATVEKPLPMIYQSLPAGFPEQRSKGRLFDCHCLRLLKVIGRCREFGVVEN